jgi:hypothetical protein
MVITTIQEMLTETFAGSQFETSTGLKDMKYRPLCASILVPIMDIMARMEEARAVLAAQIPFAAAFFRWKGIA